MKQERNIIIAIISIFMSTHAAFAQTQQYGIAAIVNDEVVSSLDLENRTRLALITSGKPDIPQLREKARAQLLPTLISEHLQLQEAQRYSIRIAPKEIDAGIAVIEQQQQKPAGSLTAFIQGNGLSVESFRQQVEAQLAWRKLLSKVVQRDVIIGDDEVLRAQKRIARGKQIPEVQIASIIVPYVQGQEPETLLALARDIRSRLVNGADAASIIGQYKQSVDLEFGPVTWIARNQLNPIIRGAIDRLDEGDIAHPVQTPAGFQIIRLLGTRTISTMPTENAEVAMKQIILKLDNASENTEIESKMAIAREIAKYPGSCTEQGIAGLSQFDGLNIDVNYIRTTIASMTPNIRMLVEPLPVTGITEPFASEDGIHMLMLCERITIPAPLPDKEQVKQVLFEEKLQLESEKYLRKLRREAFIDVRI